MDKNHARTLVLFSDFVGSIERIGRAARVLRERIEAPTDGRPMVPIVRSAIERGAVDLEDTIRAETPFRQPKDMIDDEWSVRSMVLLRASVATLELRASQRTTDLHDWMRDVSLAIEHFLESKGRFEREVEV